MVSYSSSLKSAPEEASTAEVDCWRDLAFPSAPLAFPPQPRGDRSASDLARMIESEIIPRLMLAHRPAALAESGATFESTVGPRTMESFLRMSLTGDAGTMASFVETLMHGGLSLEEIYVDLLIPTARRLGADWEEDAISFTDVTIGLSHLQQVVRDLARRAPPIDLGDEARSACFAPCPQAQHTFGLVIIEDYFRRAGWRTWLETRTTQAEAAQTVARDWFDLFGLSAACDTPSALIASTIAAVRRASCNPDLFVMVGGRLFDLTPGLAEEVGADATAVGGREALLIADNAIRARAFG